MMYEHGLVDNPPPATPTEIDYSAHAAVAQRTAEAGIVLLQNSSDLLPLAPRSKGVVVIGAHADVGVLSGGGSSQVRSVGGNALEIPVPNAGPFAALIKTTYHASSPLKAIAERVGEQNVRFVSGDDVTQAVEAARGADSVILFADEWRTEMFDKDDLGLTQAQNDLIAAVAKANPRTVVVLETGGPVLMPWLSEVAAVLEAWYPGQRGGEAIARVLFGEVNPSGRLPVTFPAAASQPPRAVAPGLHQTKAYFDEFVKNPPADLGSIDLTGGMTTFPVDYVEGADVGYRWYRKNGLKPAFAFGHGLSYSRYSYGGLSLTGEGGAAASFTLANVGPRDGAEVAQVYAAARGQTPRLVGFLKVELAKGQRKTVKIPLDWRPLSRWSEADGKWVAPEGPITVSVGAASDDIRLSGTASAS
jgi:beta-glucosidase